MACAGITSGGITHQVLNKRVARQKASRTDFEGAAVVIRDENRPGCLPPVVYPVGMGAASDVAFGAEVRALSVTDIERQGDTGPALWGRDPPYQWPPVIAQARPWHSAGAWPAPPAPSDPGRP